MNELAVTNHNASTRSIVDTGIHDISPDMIDEMPYLKSSKRRVQYKKRNADPRHIAEPESMATLNPDDL